MTSIVKHTDFISGGRLYVNYHTQEGNLAPVVFTIHKNALSVNLTDIKTADPVNFPARLKDIEKVALAMCIKHDKQYADLEFGLDHSRVQAPTKKPVVNMGIVLTTAIATGAMMIAIGIGISLAKR